MSEDSNGLIQTGQLEQFKEDYKNEEITARDIFLPPFKEGLSNAEIDQCRAKYIS